MSATAIPITAELFALAIKDLPSGSLHFKVREIRHAIAHLNYSNQQMLPYTDGTNGDPDPVCIDAIRENETVIERQNGRLGLLKIEVEGRGLNWREFMSTEELEEQDNDSDTNGDMVDGEGRLVNGNRYSESYNNEANVTQTTNGAGSQAAVGSETTSSPWTDGTFVVGTIRGGDVSINGQVPADQPDFPSARYMPFRESPRNTTGPITEQQPRRLTDEQLRQALAEMQDSEEEDGMHL